MDNNKTNGGDATDNAQLDGSIPLCRECGKKTPTFKLPFGRGNNSIANDRYATWCKNPACSLSMKGLQGCGKTKKDSQAAYFTKSNAANQARSDSK